MNHDPRSLLSAILLALPLGCGGGASSANATTEVPAHEQAPAASGDEAVTQTPVAREELGEDAAPPEVIGAMRAIFLQVSERYQDANAPREDNGECPVPTPLPRAPALVPCEPTAWSPPQGSGWDSLALALGTTHAAYELRVTGPRTLVLRTYVRASCDAELLDVYEWDLLIDSNCYMPRSPVTYHYRVAAE